MVSILILNDNASDNDDEELSCKKDNERQKTGETCKTQL